LLAPPGTPRSIIDTLQAAVERTSPNPQVKQRFDEMGVALTPTGEAAYKTFLANETNKWRSVIDAAGIKAE
jgi:tripartite-type tricarboxylate transporter receptor subunit TctC